MICLTGLTMPRWTKKRRDNLLMTVEFPKILCHNHVCFRKWIFCRFKCRCDIFLMSANDVYIYIYRSAWSMVWAGQPFCSTFKAQSNSMYTYTRTVRLYTYICVSSERIYTVMPLVAEIAALNAWYHFCWSLIIRDCSKDKGIVSISVKCIPSSLNLRYVLL